MTQIVLDCPHCHAQKMAMEIIFVEPSESMAHDIIYFSTGKYRGFGFCICKKCSKPICFECLIPGESKHKGCDIISSLNNRDYTTDIIDVYDVEYKIIYCNESKTEQGYNLNHLPPSVEKAFKQGIKNSNLEDCEESAVSAFRRAIELAIKTLPDAPKGKNLYAKIEELETKHIIPTAMKDWAHEIRAIGNDGVHEIDGVTAEDVEASKNFTIAFLQYLISLPKEIEKRRAKYSKEIVAI